MNFLDTTFATVILYPTVSMLAILKYATYPINLMLVLILFPYIDCSCVNEGPSSDDSSDDKPCMTPKGNLLAVEQFQAFYHSVVLKE